MKASISKLSIVIPAYNEAKTIHLLLDKVIEVNLLNNIVKDKYMLGSIQIHLIVTHLHQYLQWRYSWGFGVVMGSYYGYHSEF